MAACEACGNKAGLGKKICDECAPKVAEQRRLEQAAAQAKRQEEDDARRKAEAERQRQAEIARQNRYDAFMEERLTNLQSLLDQGVTPYLYSMIYINAQSVMNGQTLGSVPDLTELQNLGWLGWEAVGTVPSTYGEALKNISYGASSGETWGAGIGGLVVGAYVLMRFAITREVLTVQREYIVTLIRKEFPG